MSNPEESASFLEYITFWYLNPLLNTGFQRPLEMVLFTITLLWSELILVNNDIQSDMSELRTTNKAEVVHSLFAQEWNNEIHRPKYILSFSNSDSKSNNKNKIEI